MTRPRARVTDTDRAHVWVQTGYHASSATTCTRDATRDVRATVAVRDRELILNNETTWKPGPGATWVQCDATLGCEPPKNRCARAWVDDLLGRVELAPERRVHTTRCDGTWLVLDIDAVVTGCQGVDGSTPPADCAKTGTHTRWFAHLDAGRRWQVVASGSGAGCTEVRPYRRSRGRSAAICLPTGPDDVVGALLHTRVSNATRCLAAEPSRRIRAARLGRPV